MKSLLIALAMSLATVATAHADFEIVAIDASGNEYLAGDGATCADALALSKLPENWVALECVAN